MVWVRWDVYRMGIWVWEQGLMGRDLVFIRERDGYLLFSQRTLDDSRQLPRFLGGTQLDSRWGD